MAELAVRNYRKHWIMWAFQSKVLPNHVEALRVHADFLESTDRVAATRLRKRAMRAARVAVFWCRRLRLNLAYALREMGLAQAGLGRTRRALKYVKQSCAVAQQQNIPIEYAWSLLVCGQLHAKLGDPEGPRHIEEATEALANFERLAKAAMES